MVISPGVWRTGGSVARASLQLSCKAQRKGQLKGPSVQRKNFGGLEAPGTSPECTVRCRSFSPFNVFRERNNNRGGIIFFFCINQGLWVRIKLVRNRDDLFVICTVPKLNIIMQSLKKNFERLKNIFTKCLSTG